ncbi:hypothetical protein HYZ76_02560, partial [Candidatus Falkowbacteria bacterium]|nr:hypothetical protein [Candidatus Falkowbacteria bacterium]
LFDNYLQLYFIEMTYNHNIWDLFRGKLLSIFDVEERNEFKKDLNKALLNNKNNITSQKIERNNKNYSPTIANWLIDYTNSVGVGEIDVVKMNEYFAASKNFQSLSGQDKAKVRDLVTLYERLKKSSVDPEGLEEGVMIAENGKFKVFREGRFEDIDAKIAQLLKSAGMFLTPKINKSIKERQNKTSGIEQVEISSVEQEVLEAYRGDSRQQKTIAKEEEKLLGKFGEDVNALRAEFFKAVQDKNINRTIACLRILALKNELENFLKDDAKLNKFLMAVWEKQYGKSFVEQFKKRPAQVKFIKHFLRYILEDRLEMNTSDAARIGLQIGNIFVKAGKKSYNKIAYFDVRSKEFRWLE